MPDKILELSERAQEAATSLLEARTSRRGILRRAAVFGSALAVAPLKFLLQPESAWAITCSNCASSSKCCSANSTFCCTLTGSNYCPSGSGECGYWHCGTNNLFYMDCCSTSSCTCHCALNQCGNRKTCCNSRFYGNCNAPGATGRIVCRVTRHRRPDFCDFLCSASYGSGNCDSPPACASNPNC
jgi:hypothetical protein